jgi:hypothetical protein
MIAIAIAILIAVIATAIWFTTLIPSPILAFIGSAIIVVTAAGFTLYGVMRLWASGMKN